MYPVNFWWKTTQLYLVVIPYKDKMLFTKMQVSASNFIFLLLYALLIQVKLWLSFILYLAQNVFIIINIILWSDLVISGTKYTSETGTSTPSEEGKTKNYITKANEAMSMPGTEGFSREMLAIKPGIATNLRFGGCGSHPDLPWVSATGQGPNGKTISGVTYKYSENQIKVVCACHGTHMSPEEFARHADAEAINSEASLATGNAAQS